MSWLKIDDALTFNEKVLAAGNEATGAWVRMLAWSSQQLSDGHVPQNVVDMIAPAKTVDRLCASGQVRRTETGVELVGYLKWNPSRAEVLAKRKADSDRKNKGKGRGLPRGFQPESDRNPDGFHAESDRNPSGFHTTGDGMGSVSGSDSDPEGVVGGSSAWPKATRDMFGRLGILTPDPQSTVEARQHLEEYAKASGEEPAALCERAEVAFRSVLSEWAIKGYPTPQTFCKHWDKVQAAMAGTASKPKPPPLKALEPQRPKIPDWKPRRAAGES